MRPFRRKRKESACRIRARNQHRIAELAKRNAGLEYGTSIESQNWRSTCRIKSTEPAQNRRIGEAHAELKVRNQHRIAELAKHESGHGKQKKER